MFKSKKKRQQQKAQAEAEAKAAIAATNEVMQNNINKYKLDDINITHDFRSSVILPQLDRNLDLNQLHSLKELDIPSSLSLDNRTRKEEPTSPTSINGSKQYEDLAAWRHLRSQNRYSNGLFGGKQRGRPKPNSRKSSEKTYHKSPLSNKEEADSVNDHLDSIAPVKDNKEESIQGQCNESEDMDDEEKDIALDEEPFEPDSDMEENYFFHDFSAEALSNEKLKTQNKKRRASAKTNKKLNLSSLARELNASRLSVIQPRESRIIMTEEDELELNKLLALQKQRISIYNNDATKFPPPSPSCSSPIPELPVNFKQNTLNDDYKQLTNSKRRSSAFDIRSIRKPFDLKESNSNEFQLSKSSEQARTTDNDNGNDPDNLQSVTVKSTVLSSNVSQLTHQHGSTLSLTNSLKRASTVSSRPMSPRMTLNHMQDNASSHSISRIQNMPGHRRSLSMDAMSVKLELDDSVDIEAWRWIENNQTHTNTVKSKSNHTQPQASYSLAGPLNKANSDQQEREEIEEEEDEMMPREQKSFGIFGGLRSASRTKSNPGSVSLKGFVRNLSSTNLGAHTKSEKRSERGMSRAAATALQHNDSKDDLRNIKPSNFEEATENKQKTKKDRKRNTADTSRTSNSGGAVRLLSQLISRSSKQKKIVKTINVEEKAASDSKKRAQVVRRTIIYVQPDSLDFLKNTEDRDSGKLKTNINEKVSPLPALNNGKVELNEGVLPLPSLASSNSSTSEGSAPIDDEIVDPCALMTKQASQRSVKRNVDRTSDVSKPSYEGSILKERSSQHHLDSIDKANSNRSSKSDHRIKPQSSRESHYMEGVELREMSDGSVVWGIVKKEGNRVSFFSPDNQNNTQYHCMHDEDREGVEEEKNIEYDRFSDFEKESRTSYSTMSDSSKNYNTPAPIPYYCLQPPPPIPKRSSLRRSPTTNSDNLKQRNSIPVISTPSSEETSTADIYYADDITLPSLLRLMRDQEKDTSGQYFDDDEDSYLYRKTAIPSVDEQLEEMMRSLTSQEGLNRA